MRTRDQNSLTLNKQLVVITTIVHDTTAPALYVSMAGVPLPPWRAPARILHKFRGPIK